MGNVALSKSEMIKWGITVAIVAVLLLIPTSEVYTFNIKMFFAVTIFGILLAAFELMPIVVVGMIMTGGYVLFKVAPMATIMAPWLSETLYMVLGGYALGCILDESGLLKRVAYWIMSKVGSNWTMLLVFIFVVGVVLTVLTFGRGYMLLAPLCLGLCKSLNILGTKMAVSVAWACMLGGIAAKTSTYCVSMYAVICGAAQGLLDGFNVTFASAVGHNWPMAIVSLGILLIIGKWYKGDTSQLNGRDYFVKLYKELPPISYREKMAAATLVVIFLFLLTESVHGISNGIVFICFPWIAMLPIFGQDATKIVKSINFEIIFFVATCLSIGTIASSMGFGDLIAQYALPIFEKTGNNIFIVFGCIFLIVFLLNFLMTPMAIWGLFTAPAIQIALTLGIEPSTFVYALAHCAEAIIMPYEYTPYLIVYSFGMIGMKDFIKTSCLRCTLYFLGFLFLLVPYWHLIGLL